jgi:hypothetical protein
VHTSFCGSSIGYIADPDLAFLVNADPDPDGYRVLTTKVCKIFQLKIQFFNKRKLQFSLCLHEGRLSYRRSLQPSKYAVSSLFSVNDVIFVPPDPKPADYDQSGSGSTTLVSKEETT